MEPEGCQNGAQTDPKRAQMDRKGPKSDRNGAQRVPKRAQMEPQGRPKWAQWRPGGAPAEVPRNRHRKGRATAGNNRAHGSQMGPFWEPRDVFWGNFFEVFSRSIFYWFFRVCLTDLRCILGSFLMFFVISQCFIPIGCFAENDVFTRVL